MTYFFVPASCNVCQQVIEMASSKHKGFNNKKLNSELGVVVRSLRKENACLKKTLVEFSRQHSEHNKLVEVKLVKQSCFCGIYPT